MASTQDYLFGQQSINPYAQQVLQQSLQSGDAAAQAQYQAALSSGLTDPNIAAAQTNAMTPTLPANRANQQNLNFGSLAALASATPQYSFTPQATPDAAVGAGVTSAANFQQQAQAQRQIADIINQQQQAIIAEQQNRQATAERLAMQQMEGLKAAFPGASQQTLLGIMASGKAGDVLNEYFNPYAKQQGLGLQAGLQGQQLTDLNQSLAQPGQSIPISPVQQAQAGTIVGGKFNQYEPMVNKAAAEQQIGIGTEATVKARGAAPLQAQEITKGDLAIQTAQLDNFRKNTENSFLEAENRIKLLEAQNKLDEAGRARQKLDEGRALLARLTPEALAKATPQELGVFNAQLAANGIDAKIPIPEAPKTIAVKTGKDTQDVYTLGAGGQLQPLVIGGKPVQPVVQQGQPQPAVKATAQATRTIKAAPANSDPRFARISALKQKSNITRQESQELLNLDLQIRREQEAARNAGSVPLSQTSLGSVPMLPVSGSSPYFIIGR
jgi:hypothetical protein